MVDVTFFIAAFLSEVIGTVAGFGSSTVFLPLALFFVDFKTALVLVAFFHLFGNLGRAAFFSGALDKTLLLKFGIASVAFTVIGALFVNYVDPALLKALLGVFLMLYAANWLAVQHSAKLKQSSAALATGGALSGFLAGLIGTGGALRAVFLNAFGLKKESYIATAAIIAIAVDATRIPVYLASGFLKAEFYTYLPILLVVAIIGSFVGKSIVNKLPQETFRKIVAFAILLIGIKFLADYALTMQIA